MRSIRLDFTPSGDLENDAQEFARRITACGMQLFDALSYEECAALASSFCLYYASLQAILACAKDDTEQPTLRTNIATLTEILDNAGIKLESTILRQNA